MTSFYDNYDYYKKMLELQEKLRKSEEERIRLEERFKILVQESRNRHDACINRLRLRYIEFLEEQRTRDEKNHKLFEALDRVDNSLTLMTTKTDRLNILRKQYESYLHRIHTIPLSSTSNINDDNITNQAKNKYLKKDITTKQISPEIENVLSPKLLRLNSQKNRSISPSSASEGLIKSVQNTSCDYYQRNITQSNLNQQRNDQNIFQSYPIILQNNELIQQLPTQNLLPQKQSYIQIDSNLHVPYVSSNRSSSLNQQTLSHYNFNKPLSKQMEIAHTITHFVNPEHTINDISQCKSLDISKNQYIPINLQYIHSSSVVQSSQQENNKILLNNIQMQTKDIDELSPVHKTISTSVKQNDTSSLNKSLTLSRQVSPNYFDYSWKKSNYFKPKHKFVSDIPVHSLKTFDVDNTIKRDKHFTPKISINTRLSTNAKQSAIENKRRTTMIVENELDSYIDKIRKLHYDLDTQSLEELDQEQNITDNILNISSLNDNLGDFVEHQSKEKISKEVEKVLSLADDLASRTVDLNVSSSEKERINKNRNVELVETMQNHIPIFERNYVAFAKDEISSDIKLHKPKLDLHQNIENCRKENINSVDNTPRQSQQQLIKMKSDEHNDSDISLDDKIMEKDNKNVTLKNIQKENYNEKDNIYIAIESNLNQDSFDTVEDLEPWNVDLLQKWVKEIDLTQEAENHLDKEGFVIDNFKLKDNVEQIRSLNLEKNTVENRKDEKNCREDVNEKYIDTDSTKNELKEESLEPKEGFVNENEVEINEHISQHQEIEYKNKKYTNNENIIQNIESTKNQIDDENKVDNEQIQECDEINFVSDNVSENNRQEVIIQNDEYGNQNYFEDSNQTQNYMQNYETEYTDLNKDYVMYEKQNYDQNALYENNQNQNYDQNMYETNQKQNYDSNISYEINQDENYNANALYDTNQNQNYDPNTSYETNQEHNYKENTMYENNENQEYQEYINQEYMQGSSEQYEEYIDEQYDSENQYEHDPNIQYQEDTNQQYEYAYDQQYDSNQISDTHVNQSFPYTDYDPNQIQQEENKETQECKELQELKHKKIEEKLDTKVENKNEKLSSENEEKKTKDVIKSLLDSDTDSTIERNISNTESDFDFN
ncbi:putative uncharacterized protein DDB_G0282133 [Apis laboriosa]|uniref:putative uncharacterized protein DDB_G0282133 n=1 Tax=Apis laboriosa TaxID=183418 RepID=UPI001CC6EECA|nr:putative uncharacterized protein DDB_G0282133 [Apis laboriosa]